MPDSKEAPPAYTPPASEAEERERFSKFMGDFLEEDEPTEPPQPKGNAPTPAPTGAQPQHSPSDIEGAVSRALEAREKNKVKDESLLKLQADIEELKKPRKAKWYEPWTLFNS